jgi:hypothetical protein
MDTGQMTRASNEKDYPGISVSSGGREVWNHNPDRCEIESVEITRGSLTIKCSAGGFDRGVAIQTTISLDFIMSHLTEMFSEFSQKQTIEREEEVRRLKKEMKDISESWLRATIDVLPLTQSQRYAISTLGVATISDLCNKSKGEVSALAGIGDQTVKKIDRWLADRGLKYGYSRR